jgi:hypothetical protein
VTSCPLADHRFFRCLSERNRLLFGNPQISFRSGAVDRVTLDLRWCLAVGCTMCSRRTNLAWTRLDIYTPGILLLQVAVVYQDCSTFRSNSYTKCTSYDCRGTSQRPAWLSVQSHVRFKCEKHYTRAASTQRMISHNGSSVSFILRESDRISLVVLQEKPERGEQQRRELIGVGNADACLFPQSNSRLEGGKV